MRIYANDPSGGRWLSDFTSKPWASLATLDRQSGVWVNLSAGAQWSVAGLVPESTSITLREGWNLIGYPGFVPRTADVVLAGVSYSALEGYDSAPPYFLKRLSSSDVMAAGSGYWVQLQGAEATIIVSN